jgi:very-short-patch-repair endonuclease
MHFSDLSKIKAGEMPAKKIFPYNPKLKQSARELRKHSTLSEVLLWQQLKGKKMLSFDFDRQKPIGNYIVNFFCSDLMLAIEIDGASHSVKGEQDVVRQKSLEEKGFHFLRFEDKAVKRDMKSVLDCIQRWIEMQINEKKNHK